MSRKVIAFVPQHTTTKSRVMAIVDKGNGNELDAIATLDWPYEAVAICNILNSPDRGLEDFSGLWLSLPASVRAGLKQAAQQRVDDTDKRQFLATWFVSELDVPDLPGDGSDIDWARLFPVAQCPANGCDYCDGCPPHAERRGDDAGSNQCGPGGSCRCLTQRLDEEDDPCPCGFWGVGPRWAAALYQSLSGTAEVLLDQAEGLMWGNQGPAVGFPPSLIAQPPEFFVRLAQTCIDLCALLARGVTPVPHTIAELLMLDEAARSHLEGHMTRTGLDIKAMKQEFEHLPEGHGDFEMDALWMFQFTDSDWDKIAESETTYEPYSMDRIFDTLPEAAEWPRNADGR
ncbi:hypothetical protein AB0875_16825 [Micromonospora gifhornensis]|uniref:hypothetical protein n=1 Tax=Micromonospora gifhornensis TaxID=84594 RepID=UPI0034519888